jgi:hypothetical protein
MACTCRSPDGVRSALERSMSLCNIAISPVHPRTLEQTIHSTAQSRRAQRMEPDTRFLLPTPPQITEFLVELAQLKSSR